MSSSEDDNTRSIRRIIACSINGIDSSESDSEVEDSSDYSSESNFSEDDSYENGNISETTAREISSDDEEFLSDPDIRVAYKNILQPIKKNNHRVTELIRCYRFSHLMSPEMWVKVSRWVGRNTYMLKVDVGGIGATDTTLAAILEGLKDSRSLRTLRLGGINRLSGEGVASICHFLNQKQCMLKELDLSQIDLPLGDLSALALALKSSNDIQILRLDSSLKDGVDWRAVVPFLAQLDWRSLRKLHLKSCNIGIEGCRALSELLRKVNCRLKLLDLQNNCITDECCSILARALQKNSQLKTLELDKNRSISADGLDHFFRLVCDLTSIQATYDSNITLNKVSHEEVPLNGSNVAQRLNDLLTVNLSGSRLQKVFLLHLQCTHNQEFDITPLLDLDVKLMPHLLSFFGKDHNFLLAPSESFRHLYHIFRYWNLPRLFEFPSPDRVRFGLQLSQKDAVISELKAKNSTLKLKNTYLVETAKDLKVGVERLKEEITELRLEKEEMEKKLGREIAKLRAEIDSLKVKG